MGTELVTRGVESSVAAETYITATSSGGSLEEKAEDVFSAITDELCSKDAYILQERVFAGRGAMQVLSAARRKIYGELDDGVSPSFLAGKEQGNSTRFAVQVHAVSGAARPSVLELDGLASGRVFQADGRVYVTLSGVTGIEGENADTQARTMLERGEAALKSCGGDLLCVPRTWMWLGDILSWYDDFNSVRNEFFAERGLIGKGSREAMPASTGIGLWLSGKSRCAMDLVAVIEPAESLEFLSAVGRQQCALEYGSAFSRASRAITPGGRTDYVSGTASIDASGETTHPGDISGQIEETIRNVQAVLDDLGCLGADVVQAIAYGKNGAVLEVFEGVKESLSWPWISRVCDICRDDLLFEIELTCLRKE